MSKKRPKRAAREGGSGIGSRAGADTGSGSRGGGGLWGDGLQRVEWAAAILLTLAALLLHFRFLINAGPLWRDEVNTAEFAGMPSLHEIFDSLKYDGFPPLVTLLLRGWIHAGWGSGDQSLRVFGFAVGIAFLGALWLTSRYLRCPTPLFSLTLIGLNFVAIRAVDSIRPYGVGMVMIIATLGLVWKAVESPSLKRFVAAGLLAVLSVQCMYQNAFLLLGICVAGAAGSLRRSDLKTAGAIVLVGVAAALSLLPYRASIAGAQSWNVVVQCSVSMKHLLTVLIYSLGPGGPATALPWLGLAILSGWVAFRALRPRSGGAPAGARPSPTLFAGVVLIVASAAFLIALKSTRLQTQPWYYVPLLATIAPALDASAWAAATTRAWRVARLLCVLGIAGAMALPAWRQMTERRTNVDIVASLVGKEAATGDFILVSPWYYGVSFHRYYKGPVEWATLPSLEDLRIHRYDLIKVAMTQTNPITSILEKMTETLMSGHRLWLVGMLPDPRSVEEPAALPPPPNAATGWYCEPYLAVWAQQAAYFLKFHAIQAEARPTGAGPGINPYENVPVVVVSGWR